MFDFTGFGENILTFKTNDETISVQPVTVIENGTVGKAEAGVPFCGICKTVRGGGAAVLVSGFVTMPYTGDAPAFGVTALVSDGNGGVQAAQSGKTVTVITVDEDTNTVGFIF